MSEETEREYGTNKARAQAIAHQFMEYSPERYSMERWIEHELNAQKAAARQSLLAELRPYITHLPDHCLVGVWLRDKRNGLTDTERTRPDCTCGLSKLLEGLEEVRRNLLDEVEAKAKREVVDSLRPLVEEWRQGDWTDATETDIAEFLADQLEAKLQQIEGESDAQL